MAINVNENGTIKEIGTKISGFTIDDVDLLWDNHLIPAGNPSLAGEILSNLNKYRFLIVLYNYPVQIYKGTRGGSGFNCYDLEQIRQSGFFNYTESSFVALSAICGVQSILNVTAIKDENGIESFKIPPDNSSHGALVTAFGIACSITETE